MYEVITTQVNKRGLLTEKDSGFVITNQNDKFLSESKAKKYRPFSVEHPYVYAVLQKAGIENRNGRIYPKEILEREVNNYQELISIGAAVGESDHADDSTISIKSISMNIVEVWWEGATVLGKIHLPISRGFREIGIISCHADNIANLILNNVQIGISSRGVGSLIEKDGKNIVDEDFELLCWDWVTTPSTIGAWVYDDYAKTLPHISKSMDYEETVDEDVENYTRHDSGNLADRLRKMMGSGATGVSENRKKPNKSNKIQQLKELLK